MVLNALLKCVALDSVIERRRVELHIVTVLLVISLVFLRGLCVAQEGEPPALAVPSGGGSGSVFAPSGYIELIAPVQEKVDLNLYGFYIGELKVPVAQIDVPIRTTKFLTITPSYMYYWVPASGLNKLAPRPGGFADSYEEHQFRIAGTFTIFLRNFEIQARNMYVRRFRPTPIGDINRYRGKIQIAHPVAVRGRIWKPFAAYETYYDERSGVLRSGGWNRDRVWTGVTLPLMKQVWFQPSYLWETSEGTKDVHYLMFALIIRTG